MERAIVEARMAGMRKSNHCIQARPNCALLFILAQVPGALDADR